MCNAGDKKFVRSYLFYVYINSVNCIPLVKCGINIHDTFLSFHQHKVFNLKWTVIVSYLVSSSL